MSKKRPLTRKQRRKRKIILFAFEIIVLLILIAVLVVAMKMGKINRQDINEKEIKKNDVDKTTTKAMEKYTTFALFGLDNRTNGTYDSGNADSIMVVSIDNKTKEVKIASVYRDSFMKIDNDSYSKINAAYAQGGAKQMLQALDRNLDLHITDYVAVDWYALAKAVDLLGGIKVEVTAGEANLINQYIYEAEKTTKIKSHNGKVVAGMNTLDGIQALSYARIRHIGNDFQRTERQRTVVNAMLVKAKSAGVGTLLSIIDEIMEKISTSMSYGEMASLAKDVMSYSIGETTGFPYYHKGMTVGRNGDCLVPADLLNNVSKLHGFLFENESYIPSSQLKTINDYIIRQTGVKYVPPTKDDDGN